MRKIISLLSAFFVVVSITLGTAAYAADSKKPIRIPTKQPFSAKLKILDNKKKQSLKKEMRQKPKLDT